MDILSYPAKRSKRSILREIEKNMVINMMINSD